MSPHHLLKLRPAPRSRDAPAPVLTAPRCRQRVHLAGTAAPPGPRGVPSAPSRPCRHDTAPLVGNTQNESLRTRHRRSRNYTGHISHRVAFVPGLCPICGWLNPRTWTRGTWTVNCSIPRPTGHGRTARLPSTGSPLGLSPAYVQIQVLVKSITTWLTTEETGLAPLESVNTLV